MKFKIVAFVFVLLLISCGKKDEGYFFDDNVVEMLAQEPKDLPSRFMFQYYVRCSDGMLAEVPIGYLRHRYELEYKEMSYEEFLRESINQKLLLNCESKLEKFSLDKEVSKQYKALSFDDFIQAYCKKINDQKFEYIHTQHNDTHLQTVSYYCFINNYYITTDCYIGADYFIKSSQFYE